MPIELPRETRARVVESVKRYAREELELDEFGDLKASLLLDFMLEEIGPSVYNLAVEDAQRHVLARVEEMGGVVHQREFGYWKK